MKDKKILNCLIIGYLIFVIFFLTASIHLGVRLNKIRIFEIRLDYILHFVLFIPWMILARWRWGRGEKEQALFFLMVGAGLLLGGVTEVIQIFVPNRSFSINDFTANSLGIFVGALIAGWGRGAKCQARQGTL